MNLNTHITLAHLNTTMFELKREITALKRELRSRTFHFGFREILSEDLDSLITRKISLQKEIESITQKLETQ